MGTSETDSKPITISVEATDLRILVRTSLTRTEATTENEAETISRAVTSETSGTKDGRSKGEAEETDSRVDEADPSITIDSILIYS